MRSFFSKFIVLAKIYWTERNSRGDLLRVLGVIALTVLNVYLSTLFNEWKNAFYTALQNYNYDQVVKEMYWFCKLAVAAIIVSMYAFYLQQIVALNWRRHLTDVFIGDWLEGNRYYLLGLDKEQSDNPDQRIGEDIRIFIEKTLKFTIGVLNALLTFVLFVNILWALSSVIPVTIGSFHFNLHGYIVWIAIFYSVAGTCITHLLGYRLNVMNYAQQRFEADFRYAMMRLKEYAESISLYKGIGREKNVLDGRLTKLLANFEQIILKERQITALKSGYFQTASIIPVLVAVPLYMKQTINLGGLMQSASAFTRVTGSLSYFVLLYTEFAEWQSVVGRLYDFHVHLQEVEENLRQEKNSYTSGTDHIEISDFVLWSPNLEKLFSVEKMVLNKGVNTMITGENGVGKSTFLKAVAGIWPFYSGSIACPATEKMLFLSQKPYLPLGTLLECISYPLPSVADEKTVSGYLDYLDMGYLKDKLYKEADWQTILSLGEQQKLGIIRACLINPEWLVLDEATANMDMKSTQKAYAYITNQLSSTIISVGHKADIKQYHQKLINIENGVCSQIG